MLLALGSVFWDLYCAAPERRETCEHSSEAKAFHDYVSTLDTVARAVNKLEICPISGRIVGIPATCRVTGVRACELVTE